MAAVALVLGGGLEILSVGAPNGQLLIGAVVLLPAALLLLLGLQEVQPGSRPSRCARFEHDWRRSLTGLPGGRTCRNCLWRADKVALAWGQPLSAAVPSAFLPGLSLFVPAKGGEVLRAGKAKAILVVDAAGHPALPVVGPVAAWPVVPGAPPVSMSTGAN